MLALVVLEGLLYTEIADVLDVPVGTVMSRMHRAREGTGSMATTIADPLPAHADVVIVDGGIISTSSRPKGSEGSF